MDNYESSKDTIEHIKNVIEKGSKIIKELSKRFATHDQSKLYSPEKEAFDEFTPKLKDCTYGSEEYKGYLKEMNIALKHHYLENRHHPEYHKNGIKGMGLVDVTEMLVDWICASERHDDGNIGRSIEYNSKRFNYSHDLKRILVNTVKDMYKYSVEIGMTSGDYGIYYGDTIDEFHECISSDEKMSKWHDILINGYYSPFKNEDGEYEYETRDTTVDNCICIYWRVKEK